MQIPIDKVKEIREERHCSLHTAKHAYIKGELQKKLKHSCTIDDLRRALEDVVEHGYIQYK